MRYMNTNSNTKRTLWAIGISSAAVFMVTLDNLVVSTALPTIRRDLHASLQSLEWTVNAYTLTFAVLLLTGAALGDRFGRRRLLAIGLSLFTVASAAAALAPSATALVVARAAQGIGGAACQHEINGFSGEEPSMPATDKRRAAWTLGIASAAVFMPTR